MSKQKQLLHCNRCIAETGNHEQCKRLASCELNCKLLCWQHALQYGGKGVEGKFCEEPKFTVCDNKNSFPCKDAATKTILWSAEDEKQTYLSPGPSFKSHERKKYMEKFNQMWKNEALKTANFKAVIETSNNQSKIFDKNIPLSNFLPYNPKAKPKKSSIKHATKNSK